MAKGVDLQSCDDCYHPFVAHPKRSRHARRCLATIHAANAGERAYSYPCPCLNFKSDS